MSSEIEKYRGPSLSLPEKCEEFFRVASFEPITPPVTEQSGAVETEIEPEYAKIATAIRQNNTDHAEIVLVPRTDVQRESIYRLSRPLINDPEDFNQMKIAARGPDGEPIFSGLTIRVSFILWRFDFALAGEPLDFDTVTRQHVRNNRALFIDAEEECFDTKKGPLSKIEQMAIADSLGNFSVAHTYPDWITLHPYS